MNPDPDIWNCELAARHAQQLPELDDWIRLIREYLAALEATRRLSEEILRKAPQLSGKRVA